MYPAGTRLGFSFLRKLIGRGAVPVNLVVPNGIAVLAHRIARVTFYGIDTSILDLLHNTHMVRLPVLAPISKYGRMRQRYLKEHRPGLYSSLILSEKLYPHLLEIDRAAQERMDAMLPRMMEAAGVTEELKARDPMRWVGLTNTLKAQAEEIVFQELIYG